MAKVLTEKGIKRIRPKPGKRLHQFDAVAPGLCVRTASSGVKTYTVVARDPNGKQVWREVARVGVISLADAREKAREGVARIKAGLVRKGDPLLPPPEPEIDPDTMADVVARFLARQVIGRHCQTKYA